MTSEAMRLENAKARAWKNYISNRSNYCRIVYIWLRNDLKKLTRNLRISFEQRMITSIKYKPKLFWKYVNSRLKTRQTIPTLLKPDGDKTINDDEKATTLNNHFMSVFTQEDMSTLPTITPRAHDDKLETIEITASNV